MELTAKTKFKAYIPSRLIQPYISIRKNNTFYFSPAFIKEQDLAASQAMVLFYDNKKNSIGFKFLKDKKSDSSAYRLQKIKNNPYGAMVTSGAFFSYFNLDLESLVGKYNPRKVKIGKEGLCYMIKLNKKLS